MRLRRAERLLTSRLTIVEATRAVCDLASQVAPLFVLRTLDAIHVATFLLASRTGEDFEILTTDDRIREALGL